MCGNIEILMMIIYSNVILMKNTALISYSMIIIEIMVIMKREIENDILCVCNERRNESEAKEMKWNIIKENNESEEMTKKWRKWLMKWHHENNENISKLENNGESEEERK